HHQRGRLPGPRRSEQGDKLPLLDRNRYAVDGALHAVVALHELFENEMAHRAALEEKRCRSAISRKPASTSRSNSDAATDRTGSACSRIASNIRRGSVATSRPEMKRAIVVSSKECTKASSAETRNAGRSTGSVTRRKAIAGGAPRLCAARSRLRSKPF